MDLDHYFVGITRQREIGGIGRLNTRVVKPAHAVYPTGRQLLEFSQPMVELLTAEAAVSHCFRGAVLGRYGGSQELSVGLEIGAGPAFPVARFAGQLFELARQAEQQDAFVARVLPPDEWADNTRPGLTVLFRQPQRIGALRQLTQRITDFPGDGWPIDGFTTIPVEDGSVGWVTGFRYLFLPEISIRWDAGLRRHLAAEDDAMDIILLDQATKLGRLCLALAEEPMVERAWRSWFDVIVGGIEDYRGMIESLERTSAADQIAAETSMSRKPFSELLGLTNQGVLAARLASLG